MRAGERLNHSVTSKSNASGTTLSPNQLNVSDDHSAENVHSNGLSSLTWRHGIQFRINFYDELSFLLTKVHFPRIILKQIYFWSVALTSISDISFFFFFAFCSASVFMGYRIALPLIQISSSKLRDLLSYSSQQVGTSSG